MKILRLLALATILGMALVGCRKELPTTIDPRQRLISSWADAFEAYWDGMNHNYVFWDVDPTDWDKVYADYKPKFAKLELNKREDDSIAVTLIDELSSTLIDHHMSITIKTKSMTESDSVTLTPCVYELRKRSYFHNQYDKRLLYAAAQFNETKGRITNMKYGEQPGSDKDTKIEILSYLIDGNVAYLTVNQFDLKYAMSTNPEGPVDTAFENFFYIIQNTPGLKGIILDVRQNGGGNTDDLRCVLGPLINERVTFGQIHTKNGLGRLDYSPWIPMTLDPTPIIGRNINIPIIALVDLYSVSLSEAIAMAVQALPNGHVIGERTWGAHGPLINMFEFSYAGSYATGNSKIISVRTSTDGYIDINGNCLEGIGVTPDLEVLLDIKAMDNAKDNQLERAITYIHNGN